MGNVATRANKYEQVIFGLLLVYALATNLSVGITSTCIVLMIATTVLQKVKTKAIPCLEPGIKKVFLIYFFFQLIIALFSWNTSVSVYEVFSTFTRVVIPMYYAMSYIRSTKQLVLICVAVLTSLLISDFTGLYQLSNNILLRVNGASDNPNMFAVHIIMTLPLMYMVFRNNILGNYVKYYMFFVLGISTVMLLIARSRSSWVTLVCMIAVLLYCDEDNRKLLIKAISAFVILLVGIGIFMPEFVDRIASIVDLENKSNSDRFLMWQASWAMFMDYPLTGVGQEQWQQAYYGPYNDFVTPYYYFSHPHNNIIQQLAQGGLCGVFSYCFLHLFFAYKLLKMKLSKKTSIVQCCGVVGLLIWLGLQVTGIFDVNLDKIVIMREYWFIMGAMLSAVHYDDMD